MRRGTTPRSCLITVSLLLVAVPVLAGPPGFRSAAASVQEEGPGRGDDLGRIRAWRGFLERAERAFFAARMNTEAVRRKVVAADERIEELEAAAESAEPDAGGRSDITGDIGFLDRAHRAFTAAHLDTAEVQKWLSEARDKQ